MRYHDTSLGKSNFTGVYISKVRLNGGPQLMKYRAQKTHNGIRWLSKYFDTEIEAAKAYDRKCIEFGLDPVNIFKRK